MRHYLLAIVLPCTAAAQSLDLTIHNTGLSIGDSRFVRGIRLNFRDRNLERIVGINATMWMPYDDAAGGVVQGLALGLPATGARRIEGIGIGILGIGVEQEFTGLGVGVLGIGSGGAVRGILIGGLGVGSGGDVTGITIGGLGAGSGGHVKGLTIGGLGAGAGGSISGVQVGLLGVGSGGDVTGISIGGLGVGAGGTVRGLAMGVVGVGAPSIRGIVIAGGAGGSNVKGGILAPAYFKIESDERGPLGRVTGVTLSAFNHVKGEQFGLSLGLLNYAWELNGVQIGLINYAGNNQRGLRVLPLFNKNWN